MGNLDEIARTLPKLSGWPWREGEKLEAGSVIMSSDGNEVGCAFDQEDLAFIIAAPQLVESLLYEVRRLRKALHQRQSAQSLFSRERSLP